MDPNATPAAKQAAFAARVKWLRGQPLGRGNQALARINSFIRYWGNHGVIVRQDGPLNDSTFPSSIWVETGAIRFSILSRDPRATPIGRNC